MKQDINIQLTGDQEHFLMVYAYSGLIGLSFVACLLFWIIFDKDCVPRWLKRCLNFLIVSTTVCGIVLTILYLPKPPTEVFLTAESNDGGVEIFEGFVCNITDLQENECKLERAGDGQLLLKCANLSLVTRFAAKKNSFMNIENEMIILHNPDKAEDSIFEALNNTILNVFLGQNKEFQNQLEVASCLQRLKCHYQDSQGYNTNVCANILVSNEKKHCPSTCTSVPTKSIKQVTTEELNELLEMNDHQRSKDPRWSLDTVKKGTTKDVPVLCEAPKHFFEAEQRSKCKSRGDFECQVKQVKCVGNNQWELSIESRNECRLCQTDKDCLKIEEGNICQDGVCLFEMLFRGLANHDVDMWKLVLFDPSTRKETSTCNIPALKDGSVQVADISFNQNRLYAFEEKGNLFSWDQKQKRWISVPGSMAIARKRAATLSLQDGRWFVTGGIEVGGGFEVLKSSEILTKFGGWKSGPSLEVERMSHCMVEVDKNKILIAGGIEGKRLVSAQSRSAFILDLKEGTSWPVGNLRKERSKHSCALLDNKVYLVGNGETEILEDGVWKEGPLISTSKNHHGSLAVVQNRLFYSDPENFFMLNNGTWEQIEAESPGSVLPLSVLKLQANSDNLCIFP